MASPFDGLDPNSPEYQDLLSKMGQAPVAFDKQMPSVDSGALMDSLFGQKGSYQNGKLVPDQQASQPQSSAISGDPFDVQSVLARLKGGDSSAPAQPADISASPDPDADTFGVRSALEKMLGRGLSPGASSQLTSSKSDDGTPYMLSSDRNPDNAAKEDTPADDDKDDVSEDDASDDSDGTSAPTSKSEVAAKAAPAAPERQSLDFGDGANEHTLDKALASQSQALKDAQFQRGIEQLSGGIAKIAPNNEQSNMMRQAASSPIQEYLLRNQEAANDPNSGLSKGLRAYMGKLGMDVSDGATANQLKQVMPYIFKDVEAKQAQKTRSEDLAEKLAERKEEAAYRNASLKLQKEQMSDRRDEMRQDKLDKQDTDRLDKASKLVTAEVASGRSAFGQAARNYQSIQNAQAMLDGSVDPNQLDNRQVYELTRVMDRVLSQSGGTMGGAEHLTPDTARSRLSKLMEFVSNKRQGAQAGDFVKTFSSTLDRESGMAQKQMGQTQKSLLAPYKDLNDRHPDQMKAMLEQKGIPGDVFESSKSSKSEGALPKTPVVQVDDPKDQAAVAMIMQKNPGISLEEATTALHNYKNNKQHGQ